VHVATYVSSSFSVIETCSVPDLALCLGVLKHRVPLARGWGGGPLSCQNIFAMDFYLSLEAFCFGAIPDRVI
jgi:hypothetical protein